MLSLQNRQIKSQLEAARRNQEEFGIITENMQEGLLVIDSYTMIFHGCGIGLIIIENRSVLRNIGDTVIFLFDLFQIIYTILLYTIYQISCFFFQLSIDLFSKMLIKDCHNTCNPKNQYSRSYQYV